MIENQIQVRKKYFKQFYTQNKGYDVKCYKYEMKPLKATEL